VQQELKAGAVQQGRAPRSAPFVTTSESEETVDQRHNSEKGRTPEVGSSGQGQPSDTRKPEYEQALEREVATSFALEVQENGTTEWVRNGLRFAAMDQAEEYGRDLFSRWAGIQSFRVIQSSEPANYTFVNRHLEALGQNVKSQSTLREGAKERLIREAYEIAREIGFRGFMAKWMTDKEAMQEWPDRTLRERELRTLWGQTSNFQEFAKTAAAMPLEKLALYRDRLQAQLELTNDFSKLFDLYVALGAYQRANAEHAKEVNDATSKIETTAPEATIAKGHNADSGTKQEREQAMSKTNEKPVTKKSGQQLAKLAAGDIRGSVWLNQSEKGEYLSVSIARVYKTPDGTTKTTHSYKLEDLSDLSEVALGAQKFVQEQSLKLGQKQETETQRVRITH
jgi:hypothetical protein